MKVLGVVQWTNKDKAGFPIAGVKPVVEFQKSTWRPIDATEEFPANGQVFWPNAQAATEGALVSFRAEPNPGQKDEFKVVEPRFAHEVIDLRAYGDAAAVRSALAAGIELPWHVGSIRVLAWCAPDLLVGPIDLDHAVGNKWRLHASSNLHHLPTFTGTTVKPIVIDRHERLVRVDELAPTGFVDWDDDVVVLRRAVEASVRVAKQAGQDTGKTKRQIDEAAQALSAIGLGSEAGLDLYRLQRAIALIGKSELVSANAAELANALREHPAVRTALEVLGSNVRDEVEKATRTDLEGRLASEREALTAAVDARAAAEAKLGSLEGEVAQAKARLAQVQDDVERSAASAEGAIEARLRAAMDRPLELLAEVSLLRPLLGRSWPRVAQGPSDGAPVQTRRGATSGVAIKDRAELRRVLTAAARSKGVSPADMMQVHAAVIAKLVPLTIGAVGVPAIAAYSNAVCGNRLLITHVSPGVIEPRDLEELQGGGLFCAARDAKGVDGISMVLLEGINRSPIEAALLPVLQKVSLDLSPICESSGLRISASHVFGPTTVPVSPQIWHHAVAIFPEPQSRVGSSLDPSDLTLDSELLEPGEVPTEVVEALSEAWPACRELEPILKRYGAALQRLYDEPGRLSQALLHGLVLPFLVTALTEDEQEEALGKVGDPNVAISAALRTLRRRLG